MHYELFLAIPYLDAPTNPTLFALFTSHDHYLSLRTFKGSSYLGKNLPTPLSYEELLDQKRHIASLLKKLFPHRTYSNDQFLCLIV